MELSPAEAAAAAGDQPVLHEQSVREKERRRREGGREGGREGEGEGGRGRGRERRGGEDRIVSSC